MLAASGGTLEHALTISAHAHGEALLKATLLAAVPVDPDDGAAFVLQTLLVLDVLLDAAAEETLREPMETYYLMKS